MPGDLVFLTTHYNSYKHKKIKNLNVSYSNRLAKLEDIIDWDSDRGQKIKSARNKSGLWKNLSIEDNKYILSIYYPELIGRSGQKGIIERGVPMFLKDPGTEKPFFLKAPEWLYKEISKQCEKFNIEWKDGPLS